MASSIHKGEEEGHFLLLTQPYVQTVYMVSSACQSFIQRTHLNRTVSCYLIIGSYWFLKVILVLDDFVMQLLVLDWHIVLCLVPLRLATSFSTRNQCFFICLVHFTFHFFLHQLFFKQRNSSKETFTFCMSSSLSMREYYSYPASHLNRYTNNVFGKS